MWNQEKKTSVSQKKKKEKKKKNKQRNLYTMGCNKYH